MLRVAMPDAQKPKSPRSDGFYLIKSELNGISELSAETFMLAEISVWGSHELTMLE